MGTIDGLDIGTFGIYTFDFEHLPAAGLRESIRAVEEQGWGAFWFPEVGGREALSHAGYLLSVTERLPVVNAIAQLAPREPLATYGAARLLADAYPDRHILGLGVGQGLPGVTPLAAMNRYLDDLDRLAREQDDPRPIRRILAAYGPRMLELARDRAAGAHTYHVTVDHTAQAREILGPGTFLGVEHAVLFETDPDRAREIARAHLVPYLTTPYNLAKFHRLGYSEQDTSGGGSDRLVDDLVFWGEPADIADRLRAHVAAGADHVAVQVIGVAPGESAVPRWRRLAEVLLS
ncbi:putative F420-dependent oxidoreductase [Nocardia transvalensis]|uniref:Putative F420-dependent oxidoreductase n=1 Tax=Nocardia transvalensis TaxID=37333 RepID=A0A7W9PA38_9NOCA|nr:TIGR03620 family F420-dependent LLM class oxidoreductase [Nocardia transvalensis]MBB5912230.1 putative F420-dependent oxidoreductase [Nocardia transvalensis]